MNDLLTIGIILTTYLAVSIGIGIYGRSKEGSAEDYFVASRKINPCHPFEPLPNEILVGDIVVSHSGSPELIETEKTSV